MDNKMPDNPGSSMSPERFIREDILATGGHGMLYKGRDTVTGEAIVIKQLKPELVMQHPNIIARFEREGETLRQLNHPNIVKMVAIEEAEGVHSIIMEYVPGGSLRDLLQVVGHLSVPHVLEIECLTQS